jgi:hypothetical protein
MKKLMSLMLGLSLVLGSAALVLGQEQTTQTTEKTEKTMKKKGAKKTTKKTESTEKTKTGGR